MFTILDTIHERDRQTSRHAPWPRFCTASRSKSKK